MQAFIIIFDRFYLSNSVVLGNSLLYLVLKILDILLQKYLDNSRKVEWLKCGIFLNICKSQVRLIMFSPEKYAWPCTTQTIPHWFSKDCEFNKFSYSSRTRWSIIVPFSKALMSAENADRNNAALFCLITACHGQEPICILNKHSFWLRNNCYIFH